MQPRVVMRDRMIATARASSSALALLLAIFPASAAAGTRVGAQLEGGIGAIYVRPLEIEAAPCATICAALGTQLAGRARARFELAATVGGDLPSTLRADGAAAPGSRSLVTFLMGVETLNQDASGLFASLGAGVGHMTLTDALGSSVSGVSTPIPDRSVTGFAAGAGVGYRFKGGPGALRFQVALRAHALVVAGSVPANTCSLFLGLAN